jgi:hypothetical protein
MPHAQTGHQPGGGSVVSLPRKVVALDLAASVGVAIGSYGARIPDWTHTVALPQIGGEGARFAAFSEWLGDFLEQYAPQLVVLEAPLPPQAQTAFRSCAQQYGLRALAFDVAYRASCGVSEVDTGTVRFETMGKRWFSKGTAKREVMQFVRGRGVRAMSFDAADAALVFIWHSQRVRGSAGALWEAAA